MRERERERELAKSRYGTRNEILFQTHPSLLVSFFLFRCLLACSPSTPSFCFFFFFFLFCFSSALGGSSFSTLSIPTYKINEGAPLSLYLLTVKYTHTTHPFYILLYRIATVLSPHSATRNSISSLFYMHFFRTPPRIHIRIQFFFILTVNVIFMYVSLCSWNVIKARKARLDPFFKRHTRAPSTHCILQAQGH